MSAFFDRHPGLEPIVLRDEPSRVVARVTARLTMYTADPFGWAAGGAVRAFDAFLAAAAAADPSNARRQWWMTTSMMPHWTCIASSALDEVREGLSIGGLGGIRHQFELRVARHRSATDLGFSYREVDDRRRARAGVIEIELPPDATTVLLALARQLAETGPAFSMVGGLGISWERALRSTAHVAAYRWCRRYLGLDLQDPEPMSLHAMRGIPGTGWITHVGDRLVEACGVDPGDSLRRAAGAEDVRVERRGGGTLVIAGDAPSAGDNNDFELPVALRTVACALEPLFVTPPPTYAGPFFLHGTTNAFLRRLIDPVAWEEAPVDDRV